jgi:hypothetical protein
MTKFEKDLQDLILKHAIRYETTFSGYLVELENNEFVQLDILRDSNELEYFIDEMN